MIRPRVFLAALGLMCAQACSTTGRAYWLYPEPRLDVTEEAILISTEERPVMAIDDKETAVLCWGDTRHPEGYRQRGRLCRLHIQPGTHTVAFSPGGNTPGRGTLSFTAEAGKTYALEWSECRGVLDDRNQHRDTCVVKVIEAKGLGGA